LHDASVLAPCEKAGALEDRKMLHEPRKRHRGVLRELADRGWLSGKALDDRSARGVCERGEHAVQVFRTA
jgi:hypothetical protein